MPNKSIVRVAHTVALQSEHLMKVGAVLFKGGSIFRIACNSTKPSSMSLKYNEHGTRHAEVNVINNVPDEVLKGLSLLVVRVGRTGTLTCAKPCSTCFKVLLDKGIKRVYYTNYEGQVVKLSLQYVEDYKKEIRK